MRGSSRCAALVAALAAVGLLIPGSAFGILPPITTIHPKPLADTDARVGQVAPSAAQLQAVQTLGAKVVWNRWGTPSSLIKYGDYLTPQGAGSAVDIARGFISSNRELFRLSAAGVQNLELLNDAQLSGYDGHAVSFRQTFGGVPAGDGGLITVGVANGRVAFVSSTAAGDGNAPGAASLSPAQAWVQAALNLGKTASVVDVRYTKVDPTSGWTFLVASGFNQLQRARLVAFPTYTQGVRPAYEVVVYDIQVKANRSTAFNVFVDAQTGQVLARRNGMDNDSAAGGSTAVSAPAVDGPATTIACAPPVPPHSACTFQGALPTAGPAISCGLPEGPYVAGPNIKAVDAVANMVVPANDITIRLEHPLGVVVAANDTATSPEAVHYEPAGNVPTGDYYVRICPFTVASADFIDPTDYFGSISFSPVGGQVPVNTPKWSAFKTSPPLNVLDAYPWNNPSTDTRSLWCWVASTSNLPAPDANCATAVASKNDASRVPWDFDAKANLPTFSTIGNNAVTFESWANPPTVVFGNIGPGPTAQRPNKPDRVYTDPWANTWFTSKCDPSVLTPGGNDILASVTNLFVGHNRIHDYAYWLGFTEQHFNLQDSNFGNTAPGPFPGGRESDPEQGNVQAGAVDGGAPAYGGRDNASQLTLNDGIFGVTQQYLFQPIAGVIYVPCVDGDFDTAVFMHEYTHAISNRMVGGPDTGLIGEQPGAMGESWSDQVAMEYLNSGGYVPLGGENPNAAGVYVTGNKFSAIRNYPLGPTVDDNPLNYSNYGYDVTGPEVHADGEIWNGIGWNLRQALIDKYNGTFPASNAALQQQCAFANSPSAPLPASQCPGNRRFIQIMFDAFLLMPPNPSFVTARNAYLAADQMRFGGANQTELWRVFAYRGLGENAASAGESDVDPTPSFSSPVETNEATITFNAMDAATAASIPNARFYVGDYEARSVPIADTDGTSALPQVASLVPGKYHLTVRAPGYGLLKTIVTFSPNQAGQFSLSLGRNVASSTFGATATGDGTNEANLIDDTEGTAWNTSHTPDVAGAQVTVALAANGGPAGSVPRQIGSVRVSALLPGDAGTADRFLALRAFEVWTCNAAVETCTPATPNCTAVITTNCFHKVYTSPANAFPSTVIWPTAPTLNMRRFDLSSPVTATHARLVVVSNQCTGTPEYHGEQDNDPTNATDCRTGGSVVLGTDASPENVIAAEFEVFEQPGAPTSVALRSFSARPAKGRITVAWRTASERSVAGFNVWRVRGGKATKLNRRLIAAKRTGRVGGAAYAVVDRSARPGVRYTYRLQVVDRAGKRGWAGSVGARAPR